MPLSWSHACSFCYSFASMPAIRCETDDRGIGRQGTATDVSVSTRGRRRGHTVPAESGGFAFVNSVVAGGTPPITDESGRWKMCRRNRQTSETQLVRSSASTLTLNQR